jgi:hypothetical protein
MEIKACPLASVKEGKMKEITEDFYPLVTFERPMFGRKDRWVCVIGGIEFSGETEEELRHRAIKMLEGELKRLRTIDDTLAK